MRLPFFYLVSSPLKGARSLTIEDEGIYMLQGMDVLNGYLPYLHHWNNSPPLVWYIYGLLMLLTGGSLTLLRIVGMLYAAVTAYVVYRTLVRHNLRAAVWAAVFYLLFSSTLQGGQSVTCELLAALPLSCIVYHLLNPSMRMAHDFYTVAACYFLCVMMLPSFIYLLPAIALLWPGRQSVMADIVSALDRSDKALARRHMAQWLLRAGVKALQLFAVCVAGYFLFWIIYWYQGYPHVLLKTLFASPVAHMPVSFYTAYPAESWSSLGIIKKYFSYYLHSAHWVVMLLTAGFVLRVAYRVLYLRDYSPPLPGRLLLILCFALLVVAARVSDVLFPYYLQQILPVLCLVMGLVLTFNWRDGKTLVYVTAVVGMLTSGKAVWILYPPLIKELSGDRLYPIHYNDYQYSIARMLKTVPMKKGDLFICDVDEILYPLTDTEPFTYVFRQDYAYSARVMRIFGLAPTSPRRQLMQSNPLFVVGHLHGKCLSALDDVLVMKYLQVSNIGGTAVYVRKNVFRNISIYQLEDERKD